MNYTKVLSIGKAMIYDQRRQAGIKPKPPVRLAEAMRQESEELTMMTSQVTTKPARATNAVAGGL